MIQAFWQRKVHLQATQDKLRAATVKVMPVTQPTLTKTSFLPNYGANIPATLQQLPELLEQATTTSETPNAMQMELSIMPDPVLQCMGPPTIPETPDEVQEQPDFPDNIAPTGHTRTGRQIQPPSSFAYAAYHCCFLAQSCFSSIADFHPVASL